MKLAYKGFNKGLVCSLGTMTAPTKYELNKIYIKQPIPNEKEKYEMAAIDIVPNVSFTYTPEKKKLKTCTNQGFHYCNTLTDVFKHYSNINGNEFAIIEVLGNFTDGPDKSITDAFRIVKILDEIEIKKISNEIQFIYRGNGFLYHMVRILTGTLLEVGTGKLKATDIQDILEAKSREKAGELVPGCGLTLVEVRYS